MALRVRTCCCAASLRTGTLTIGIIDFIGALATLILTSVAASNQRHNNWWDYGWSDDLQAMYITMAVLSGILMVADLMLLIGVSQAKPGLIIPWIIYAYVSVLSNFACAITYGVYNFDYYYDSYGYISISWSLFYLVLKMYFLLVVWSFYKEMRGPGGFDNGVNVIIQPHPYPNGPQTYPSGQMPYPNQPQPYPYVQQPYPNAQQPYPYPQPLPPMENMKRDV